MASVQVLKEEQDWERLWVRLGGSHPFCLLIFKRSPICPTSHAAEEEFANFVAGKAERKGLQFVLVDVINARPISQRIARDTQVRHASPQALLLAQASKGPRVLWHESHE